MGAVVWFSIDAERLSELILIFFGLLFCNSCSESNHFKLYNDNPFCRRERDGEFPAHHSRYISIPHLWSSSCSGRRIPTTRGFASRGRNSYSTTPAGPWRGELRCTFRDSWGIHNSYHSWLRHSW